MWTLVLSMVTLEFHGCSKAFPRGIAEEAQRVKRAQLDLRDGCPTTVKPCYCCAHSLTTALLEGGAFGHSHEGVGTGALPVHFRLRLQPQHL